VSPGEKPRDWDKEMAEIDKIMAAPPAAAPTPPVPVGKPARAPAAPAAGPAFAPAGGVGKYARLFTWVRLTLGLLLGAAMTQWPYTHGCGLPLFAYLGGVAAVLVAALWSTASSWKTRSGFAHALSLGLLLWGGFLAAREILPRVGYAKETAAWTCAASAVESPGR
jgi:hypothetical protein